MRARGLPKRFQLVDEARSAAERARVRLRAVLTMFSSIRERRKRCRPGCSSVCTLPASARLADKRASLPHRVLRCGSARLCAQKACNRRGSLRSAWACKLPGTAKPSSRPAAFRRQGLCKRAMIPPRRFRPVRKIRPAFSLALTSLLLIISLRRRRHNRHRGAAPVYLINFHQTSNKKEQ